MANLFGQNIGTNYKGILNLDTINTPLDATLRAVTDGEGNASGLKLSTSDSSFSGNVGIGTNVPDTTLTIKGGVAGSVGTRIATFEGNLPEILLKDTSNNTGFAIAKYGNVIYFVNTNASGGYSSYSGVTNYQGSWSFGGGFNPNGRVHIKGSGTTSSTTALLVQNSAGTELFKVQDGGNVNINSTSLLFFGDSSNFVRKLSAIDGVSIGGFSSVGLGAFGGLNFFVVRNNTASLGATTSHASAIFDITSTTKGFLPPRMTTTEKNAIATPASGLIIYDSTTNKLACYNGTTWNDLF